MNKLITERFDWTTGNYMPLLTENVNDELALQLIKKQVGKVPVHGFYRHKLETPSGTYTWYNANVDEAGFLQALSKQKP